MSSDTERKLRTKFDRPRIKYLRLLNKYSTKTLYLFSLEIPNGCLSTIRRIHKFLVFIYQDNLCSHSSLSLFSKKKNKRLFSNNFKNNKIIKFSNLGNSIF